MVTYIERVARGDKDEPKLEKAELVLRKFCEEHCRDRVSYDLAMHPTTCSKKLTVALWKIKAALKWLGLLG